MSNFLRFRGCPSANVLEYAMLPHDKKQLPIAAPHDQSVLYGLKKFSSTPGVAPKEQQAGAQSKKPVRALGQQLQCTSALCSLLQRQSPSLIVIHSHSAHKRRR